MTRSPSPESLQELGIYWHQYRTKYSFSEGKWGQILISDQKVKLLKITKSSDFQYSWFYTFHVQKAEGDYKINLTYNLLFLKESTL